MQNARVPRLLERSPALRFGSHTGDPRSWARKVRAAVQRLALPVPVDLSTESADGDVYTLRSSEGTVRGVFRRPSQPDFPAVLVCVPTGVAGPGEALAAAGIASFTVEFADDPAAGAALLLAGRSQLATQADDAVGALRWLAAQPGVRADQVGLYGTGAGGAVALHAALLHGDPAPIVVAGHLGTYPELLGANVSTPPAGAANVPALPGILRYADLPDLYAALLPRPLQVQADAEEAAGESIALAYKSAEVDQDLERVGPNEAAAVAFFARRLTAARPAPSVPPLKVRFDVSTRVEVADRIDQVLASGMLTQGEVVLEFEREVLRYTGNPAIAVSTGSAALDIAYHVLGVAGRTVISPVNTFFATASSAIRAGAKVDFVDMELDGFGMDPDSLRAALDRNDDVAAVVAVHIGGIVSPSLREVVAECARRGIPLIEDSAHALGARLDGQLAGTFSRMSAYSLHPAKVATSGEGGLLSAAEAADLQSAERWRDHGKVSIDRNVHDRLGTNWRLSEVHAAVGLAHLGQLDSMLAERRALAAFYDEHLDSVPLLRRYEAPAGSQSNFYKYLAFLDPSVDRADLKARVKRNHGVSLAGEVYDVLLSDQPYFAAQFAGRSFEQATYFTRHHVCLPAFPSMTNAEQRHVLHALRTELS